jgi:replicative superfamily II helicase
MTKNEKSYVSSYIDNLKKTLDVKNIPDSILKTGYCYYSMLNNNKEVIFPALSKKLKYSLDRTLQILKQIDFSYTFKNYKNTFDSISVRIKKNIPIDLVELAKIPKVGYLRAKLLYDAGFRNENDIINDIERASKIAKYNFKKL